MIFLGMILGYILDDCGIYPSHQAWLWKTVIQFGNLWLILIKSGDCLFFLVLSEGSTFKHNTHLHMMINLLKLSSECIFIREVDEGTICTGHPHMAIENQRGFLVMMFPWSMPMMWATETKIYPLVNWKGTLKITILLGGTSLSIASPSQGRTVNLLEIQPSKSLVPSGKLTVCYWKWP